MIKGVNRFTVEVSRTGSPYFERAICFVKPEFARENKLDLHRAAQRMIMQLDTDLSQDDHPENEKPQTRLEIIKSYLPIAIAALSGAAVALIFCLLIIK